MKSSHARRIVAAAAAGGPVPSRGSRTRAGRPSRTATTAAGSPRSRTSSPCRRRAAPPPRRSPPGPVSRSPPGQPLGGRDSRPTRSRCRRRSGRPPAAPSARRTRRHLRRRTNGTENCVSGRPSSDSVRTGPTPARCEPRRATRAAPSPSSPRPPSAAPGAAASCSVRLARTQHGQRQSGVSARASGAGSRSRRHHAANAALSRHTSSAASAGVQDAAECGLQGRAGGADEAHPAVGGRDQASPPSGPGQCPRKRHVVAALSRTTHRARRVWQAMPRC